LHHEWFAAFEVGLPPPVENDLAGCLPANGENKKMVIVALPGAENPSGMAIITTINGPAIIANRVITGRKGEIWP
jgi:hypothetical protein